MELLIIAIISLVLFILSLLSRIRKLKDTIRKLEIKNEELDLAVRSKTKSECSLLLSMLHIKQEYSMLSNMEK